MTGLREVLTVAREIYAASPDHSPFGRGPRYNCSCLVTACYEAGRRAGDALLYGEPAIRAVEGAANVIRKGHNEAIICWNAAQSTATVLAAFDRAIEFAA